MPFVTDDDGNDIWIFSQPDNCDSRKETVEMNAGMFAEDGCVLPNMRTHEYIITLMGKCPHTKIRAARIVIDATDIESAREYAGLWINLARTEVTAIDHFAKCATCTGVVDTSQKAISEHKAISA